MYVIQELPEADEYDTPCYFGGYFKEPKYGTMQPTWTAEIGDAFKFDDKEEAELLAHDFTDWNRVKYGSFATCVVSEVHPQELP